MFWMLVSFYVNIYSIFKSLPHAVKVCRPKLVVVQREVIKIIMPVTKEPSCAYERLRSV